LYFYGRAIQGTYILRKLAKAENPISETSSNWARFSVIGAAVLFFSLASVGLLTMTGSLTPTEVLEGKDLSDEYREALIDSNVITRGDRIQYFYSEAFSSIEEAGSILTSDRVIMYLEDEDEETQVYELYFDQIDSVELINEGNFANDSVYRVYSHSRDAYLTLLLSTEARGDVKFIERLRSELTSKK
jgi:hypothetical protein